MLLSSLFTSSCQAPKGLCTCFWLRKVPILAAGMHAGICQDALADPQMGSVPSIVNQIESQQKQATPCPLHTGNMTAPFEASKAASLI